MTSLISTRLGRILEENVEEYKKTRNPELILYRFCQNSTRYTPINDNVKRNIPGTPRNPR